MGVRRKNKKKFMRNYTHTHTPTRMLRKTLVFVSCCPRRTKPISNCLFFCACLLQVCFASLCLFSFSVYFPCGYLYIYLAHTGYIYNIFFSFLVFSFFLFSFSVNITSWVLLHLILHVLQLRTALPLLELLCWELLVLHLLVLCS
jgi:hypothetical protein